MAVARDPAWLIDKSAFARLGTAADRETWATRISRGLVRISAVTLLEIGYSARNGPDLARHFDGPPIAAMPLEFITPAAEERAIEVMLALAAKGQNRAPSLPDLLVAAIAERVRLTVLHQDKDFDLIAEITGQPLERLQ